MEKNFSNLLFVSALSPKCDQSSVIYVQDFYTACWHWEVMKFLQDPNVQRISATCTRASKQFLALFFNHTFEKATIAQCQLQNATIKCKKNLSNLWISFILNYHFGTANQSTRMKFCCLKGSDHWEAAQMTKTHSTFVMLHFKAAKQRMNMSSEYACY